MNKIKICLFPSFVGDLIEQKAISVTELDDEKKLSSILSDLSVNKIRWLNDNSNSYPPSKCQTLLYTSKLQYMTGYDPVISSGSTMDAPDTVGDLLTALTPVGDEGMVAPLKKALHNYALRFTVHRIKPKIYAIVFKQLCEVDSPHERLRMHKQDIASLLKEISMELNDKEMLAEPFYHYYLSIL